MATLSGFGSLQVQGVTTEIYHDGWYTKPTKPLPGPVPLYYIGKYIDSLPPAKRDRIIEAERMQPGYWQDCLVGTVEVEAIQAWKEGFTSGQYFASPAVTMEARQAAGEFDQFCAIYGVDATVAACKARAAYETTKTVMEKAGEVIAERSYEITVATSAACMALVSLVV